MTTNDNRATVSAASPGVERLTELSSEQRKTLAGLECQGSGKTLAGLECLGSGKLWRDLSAWAAGGGSLLVWWTRGDGRGQGVVTSLVTSRKGKAWVRPSEEPVVLTKGKRTRGNVKTIGGSVGICYRDMKRRRF
jgi:hypothetical protein